MTILSLLSSKAFPLKKVLEKLIAHRLDKDIPRVLAHLEEEIFEKDVEWIQTSYHSYAVEKQPLEYILGSVEFLGNKFIVDRNTLIPRPETEYMITAVLKEMQNSQSGILNLESGITLIDVGTGCGVLGLSCILHGAEYLDQVYLTEYYPETLEVARRNLEQKKQVISNNNQKSYHVPPDKGDPRREGVGKILSTTQLINCSLLDHPLLQKVLCPTTDNQQPATNIIIVANLPYIPEQLFEDNVEDNVKLREPKPAFVGGEDGLDWYREMLIQIQNARFKMQNEKQTELAPPLVKEGDGGRFVKSSLILFLEMMTRQVEILSREFKNHFSFEEVATFHMNIRIVKVMLI